MGLGMDAEGTRASCFWEVCAAANAFPAPCCPLALLFLPNVVGAQGDTNRSPQMVSENHTAGTLVTSAPCHSGQGFCPHPHVWIALWYTPVGRARAMLLPGKGFPGGTVACLGVF